MCICVCVWGGGGGGGGGWCGVCVRACVRDGVPLRHLQVLLYKAYEIIVASTRCPPL